MKKKLLSLLFITVMAHTSVALPIHVVITVPFERIEQAVTSFCGGIASCAKGTFGLVKNNPKIAAATVALGAAYVLLSRSKTLQQYLGEQNPMPGEYEQMLIFHDGTGKIIRFKDCKKVSEQTLSKQEVQIREKAARNAINKFYEKMRHEHEKEFERIGGFRFGF